ncbi:hypothetical protein Pelo_8270, partial [Pelomyxa schiedti]
MSFGVSPLLLGITTGIRLVALTELCGASGECWWIDESKIFIKECGVLAPALWLLDSLTGKKRCLKPRDPENLLVGPISRPNGEWWVEYNGNNKVVITNMTAEEPPVCLEFPNADFTIESIDPVKVISSQALMLVTRGSSTSLVVFDVAKTYTTKSPQFVSTLPDVLQAFPEHWYTCNALLMRNKAGQNIFIIEAFSFDDMGSVIAVEPNGVAHTL